MICVNKWTAEGWEGYRKVAGPFSTIKAAKSAYDDLSKTNYGWPRTDGSDLIQFDVKTRNAIARWLTSDEFEMTMEADGLDPYEASPEEVASVAAYAIRMGEYTV